VDIFRILTRLQAGTEDAPVLDRPAPLRCLHDSGTGYKYPGLLIYFICSSAIVPLLKRLCIRIGHYGAIQMLYYYYYYCDVLSCVSVAVPLAGLFRQVHLGVGKSEYEPSLLRVTSCFNLGSSRLLRQSSTD